MDEPIQGDSLEYSSNHSDMRGSLWFFSKDEVTNFSADIADNNALKSFKHNAILLGNTVADEANAILKTTTIAVPLKYLSKFWMSFEIKTEFESKVELKLKRTNHWILSAAVADNGDANFYNIFLLYKTQNCMSL